MGATPTAFRSGRFHDITSALAYSLAQPHQRDAALAAPYNDLTQFILGQHAQMPDFLRGPMELAAIGFDAQGVLQGGKPFRHQAPAKRARQIMAWKNSGLSFQRDFIRYFESLATLALYSRNSNGEALQCPAAAKPCPAPTLPQRAEIIVIGSGPGGAITAALLAEAGRDVLLIEEGSHLPLTSCAPFSQQEMLQKYRNGGQTVALGKNKIAYVEGRCVGGGSEINSGLYHRTPPEVLAQWRKTFQVEGLLEEDLRPHFESCEQAVSVSYLPHAAPRASLKLQEGASKLGWQAIEVPRWFRYDQTPTAARPPGAETGRRQSMTETFIPRFLRAGGKLQANTRAQLFRQTASGWAVTVRHACGAEGQIAADYLFLCAGAVHTPALLRRSGITRNVGNSFQVHPTVKIVARFPEEVNAPDMGVPVHKVTEFSPRLSFGCSISSPAYLALGLLDYPPAARTTLEHWRHSAIYYAMITGEGHGSIRPLPRFRDPLVRYALTQGDRRQLATGLRQLAQTLFAAGATHLFPSLANGPELRDLAGLGQIPEMLPAGLTNLMSIHLFSSCPMGENHNLCATDSFGRVHGMKNLFINDASLLCTAPSVNPQGSIMAIARRNVMNFLAKLPRS